MASNTPETTVKIRLVGYSAINQDNGNVLEFKTLEELIKKVSVNCLPIIDENLVKNPSYKTTSEQANMREIATTKKSSENDNVNFPCPVSPFFKRYVESHSSSKDQIFVKTNRKVVKEILGISNVYTYSQQQWNYKVKIWKGNCIQIKVDDKDAQYYSFGIKMENYLTNYNPESERHKVYSIHAIQEHNRHYIYCAEIDGFKVVKHPHGGEDEVTLIPVEIKCINRRCRSKYELQAKLGQVNKVLVAIKRDDGTTCSIASCEYDELSEQTCDLEEHYIRNLSILGYSLKKCVRGAGSEIKTIKNYKMVIEKANKKERPIKVKMENVGTPKTEDGWNLVQSRK